MLKAIMRFVILPIIGLKSGGAQVDQDVRSPAHSLGPPTSTPDAAGSNVASKGR